MNYSKHILTDLCVFIELNTIFSVPSVYFFRLLAIENNSFIVYNNIVTYQNNGGFIMKKAVVLIIALLSACTLCSCSEKDNTSETSAPNFDAASEVTLTETPDKNESSQAASKKEESKAEESKKTESKKEESSTAEKDDSIPSRSADYEASPNSIVRPPETEEYLNSLTDTDTQTDTDTDSETESDSDPDSKAATDVPYLSGLWIVEKILDSNGNECDGRDIYGSVFNYAGVLDLDENSDFELSIGIIPEGQPNIGVYEQRGKQLVLQYSDQNRSQMVLDLKKIDGVEMLLLNVSHNGNNYTIYFSR